MRLKFAANGIGTLRINEFEIDNGTGASSR